MSVHASSLCPQTHTEASTSAALRSEHLPKRPHSLVCCFENLGVPATSAGQQDQPDWLEKKCVIMIVKPMDGYHFQEG